MKKLLAALLAAALLASTVSCSNASPEAMRELERQEEEDALDSSEEPADSPPVSPKAETQPAEFTRQQAVDMIRSSAEKYNAGLKPETVTEGLPEGGAAVTRAEALVMLSNAFGKFPEPKGDAVNRAAGVAEYTDAPGWAKPAIENLNSGLLLVPAEDGLLKPDEAVNEKELDTYLRRIWALYGTRLEDDFYAYINKEWLGTAEIPEGQDRIGSMWGIVSQSEAQINAILDEVLNGAWEKGTAERKIVDYYNAFIDIDTQNKVGAAPLKPYLDQLAAVKTIAGLNAALAETAKGTAYFPYVRLWLAQDHMNGRRHAVYLTAPFAESMSEGFAENAVKALTVAGVKNPNETAELAAGMQSRLAEACKELPYMSEELDFYEEQLMNKLIPAEDAAALIPGADMGALLAAVSLKPEEKYYVMDYSAAKLKALATFYTDENAPALAALAAYMLIDNWKGDMGGLFAEPDDPKRTPEDLAPSAREMVKMKFQDYFGPIYMERHVAGETKAELTKMAQEMIEVYKGNVKKLDWMSEATKAMTIKKLDAMILQMAYPDNFGSFSEIFEVRGVDEGGSYLESQLATQKAYIRENSEDQGKPKDRLTSMDVFYSAAANATGNQNGVTVCAGLLLPPAYDPDASIEEKMASIGWIIAHEITHNFDTDGSHFDENGGLTDWWAAEDKAKFNELCQGVTDYYDGVEYAPGLVRVWDQMSASENTADLGGIACALAALKKMKQEPDYELFFKSAAVMWRESMTRGSHEQMGQYDSHAAGTNRTNLVFKTLPEFYETFDIQPGDGMYLAPEDRVKVW